MEFLRMILVGFGDAEFEVVGEMALQPVLVTLVLRALDATGAFTNNNALLRAR